MQASKLFIFHLHLNLGWRELFIMKHPSTAPPQVIGEAANRV